MKIGLVLALMALVLPLVGCGRKEEPAQKVVSFESFDASLQEALRDGKMAEAISRLESGLRVKDYAVHRPLMFRWLVEALLRGQGPDAAEARCLQAVADPELFAVGFQALVDHYVAAQAFGRLAIWGEQVKAVELPPRLRREGFRINLLALSQLGEREALTNGVVECIRVLPPEDSLLVVRDLVQMVLPLADHDGMTALLDVVWAAGEGNPGMRSFIQLTRLRERLDSPMPEQAEAFFYQIATELSDQDLRVAVRLLVEAMTKAQRWAVGDRLCAYVLDHAAGRLEVLSAAAHGWVSLGIGGQASSSALTGRLRTLDQLGLGLADEVELFRDVLYEAARREDKVFVAELLAFGLELYGRPAPDDRTQATIRSSLLDGYFLLERYEAALEVFNAMGADETSEAYGWIINKIKAHIAERDGDVDGAVRRYRAFMVDIQKNWVGSERDPTSGIRYSKAMALGFNARRIGDIYKRAGRLEEARAAYAEARAQFEAAQTTLTEKDGAEREFILGQLTAMGEDPVAAGG